MSAAPGGAIVVGGYVNGLGLVRAFAARGIPTAVIVTHPYDIAHRSRWVRGFETALDLGQRPEGLLEALARRASEWAGWALVPANDEALAAIALHHEALSSRFRILASSPESARTLLDKEATLELARSVGADLPRAYGPAVAATAERADLAFPVVVKPTLSHRFATRFGTKLFVADDRAELRSAIEEFTESGLEGQVFDLIPGGDDRIYVCCTHIDGRDEPAGALTVRKLRQSPPLFGVARVAEIAADQPRLAELTIEMLRRIGFRGTAAAEFKLDPRDGRFRLFEINGRPVIFNGLLRRAGFDVAHLAWSDAAPGRTQRFQPTGWCGVWVNLHADLLYSLLWRHPRLGVADFVRPYARPVTCAVWSGADPGPFLLQWARTGRGALGLASSGTHRTLFADRARPWRRA